MAKSLFCKTCLVLALSAQFAYADELTDRAKNHLDSGSAVEAFRLLEPVEAERAGDVEFDLILGVAAVNCGQNTRGVFALERVLSVQPQNARARAEIARAYLGLGETTVAKQEFEVVQRQGVPSEISATIDRFLDAVDRVEEVSRTTARGYIEGALGYDNNVNSATSRNTIAIPGFGGLPFRLSDDSRAHDAGLATVGAGINFRSPFSADSALVGGLSGLVRNNFGADQFDSRNLDVYAGIVVTSDRHVFSVNAQFNQYDMSDDRYRTATGLSGQWQFNRDARNQFSLYLQYANLHYPLQSIRDADRWLIGGAYAHAFREGSVVYASGYAVSERAKDGDVPWLGFSGVGVRVGGQINVGARTSLFASAMVEYRHHNDEDPSFLNTRTDQQYDVVLGASFTPARHWQITPKYTWTYNDSNSDLNGYRRQSVSVTVRRDF